MRVCSGAGCLRVVADHVHYCDECKPVSTATDDIRGHIANDRVRYKALYEGNRFQDFCRPRTFQRYPFCARCGVAPSVICDHVVPASEAVRQVRESGRFPFNPVAGFYLLSNLQGLCRSCHGRKTIEDKQHVGAWPSVLEKEDSERKAKAQGTGGG